MLGQAFSSDSSWYYLFRSPVALLLTGLQIWMLIHAIRNREWLWAVILFFGWGLAAIWYYFYIYRESGSAMSGFELPGTQSRKRIQELKSQIHHIDNAYQHFQLGDIYFQQGKLADAEKCYRAAMARDDKDIDIRAHLGQCLLRQGKVAEARPLLESVYRENPRHDYEHTTMAFAEALTILGEKDLAFNIWRWVVENHSYPRAKVQYAELCIERNLPDVARQQLTDVINDDPHAPTYQRRRDRVWVRRAKALLRQLRSSKS
jgi:hypothetical protein